MADQSHWVDFESRKHAYQYNAPGPLTWLRFLWQRITRGYDDRDIWSLSARATTMLAPRIKHYVTWQAEHGRHVPSEFEDDPAAWLEVLRKIERAFDLLDDPDYPLHGGETEVKEGLALFGTYYQDLWA